MLEAIDALGQATNSLLIQSVSKELPVDHFVLRVPNPIVYDAHIGRFCYGWMEQTAEMVLPHPVLNVESVWRKSSVGEDFCSLVSGSHTLRTRETHDQAYNPPESMSSCFPSSVSSQR